MKRILFLIFLVVMVMVMIPGTGSGKSPARDFTRQEQKVIKKANTSRFVLFHSKEMRRFVLLMNLARMDPQLCAKYIRVKYHLDSQEVSLLYVIHHAPLKPLRPAPGLHLAAWSHAVGGGMKGTIGHQNFEMRLALFLNLHGPYGENCQYGCRDAAHIFLDLMHSPGHRENILTPGYTRVGVSKKWHKTYGVGTVTVFGFPTFWAEMAGKKPANGKTVRMF